MKMKKILLTLSLVLPLTMSCTKKGCTDPLAINYNESAQKDDGNCEYEEASTNIIKSGFINSDETWTSDNIYELRGKVVVSNGTTLTIEPGTIIKGDQGTGTLASALVVARGGKICADGTPTQPIIFTSVLDNIQLGELTGTNLNENDNGIWGGVIILGNAPISAADGDVITQIEGIPVSDSYGAFGGNDETDNSGSLSYISIRHSGALIGAGNEINGLTLGGVGNGTNVSNIEVVGNLDDGVEFFGGTVNVSNILVSFQGDDGIDIDMNYSGTIDGFVVLNGSFSDEGLEVDGPEGMTHTSGLFTISNGLVYTYGGTTPSNDFKSKAQGHINNVKLGNIKIRASYQNDCVDPKTDAFTHLTDQSPKLVFTNCEYDNVIVYTASQDDNGLNTCPVPVVDQTNAENMIINTSVDNNTNGFEWTWTSIKGRL
jgi:hypothetical protein